jgi:hypothetical protein
MDLRRSLQRPTRSRRPRGADSSCTMSCSHERYGQVLWIEGYASSSSSAFASLRSFVSKPSVNQA